MGGEVVSSIFMFYTELLPSYHRKGVLFKIQIFIVSKYETYSERFYMTLGREFFLLSILFSLFAISC